MNAQKAAGLGIAIGSVAALAYLVIRPPSEGVPEKYSVVIETYTDGTILTHVNIFLNNALIGETDTSGVLIIDQLIARDYNVRAEKTGFNPSEVTFNPEFTKRVVLTLIPIIPPANLVLNPSFEEDFNGDGIPDSWTSSIMGTGNVGQCSWLTNGAESLHFVRAEFITKVTTGGARWMQDVMSKLVIGHTYRARCRYRANAIADFVVAFWDAQWNNIAWNYLDLPPVDVWTQSGYIQFLCPPGAFIGRLLIYMTEVGLVDADEVELYLVV